MGIIVRRATEGEADAIVGLARALHTALQLDWMAPFDEPHSRALVAAALHDADKAAFVACADDEIVGFLLGFTLPVWFSSTERYAQELGYWVDPAHRRDGAGAALASAFEAWAKDQGLRTAALSRSGSYQRRKLTAFCLSRGYRESSVIYVKEV